MKHLSMLYRLAITARIAVLSAPTEEGPMLHKPNRLRPIIALKSRRWWDGDDAYMHWGLRESA